mmetsp:Transcript_2579/g.7682  ORF Transcript_2579/g.7682 Transcript_2579/m.7682 type:complete len:258 (-) Transcript_2579:271-1044(-)
MFGHAFAEDGPVVDGRGDAFCFAVRVDELAKRPVALAAQRPKAVGEPARPHRSEPVVAHGREEEGVVVEAHHPLVAERVEDVPARHRVPADHEEVALGPPGFARPGVLQLARPVPARLPRQSAPADVGQTRGRVRVAPAQVALVPDQRVRVAELRVEPRDARHRRVERVAVRRVVPARAFERPRAARVDARVVRRVRTRRRQHVRRREHRSKRDFVSFEQRFRSGPYLRVEDRARAVLGFSRVGTRAAARRPAPRQS